MNTTLPDLWTIFSISLALIGLAIAFISVPGSGGIEYIIARVILLAAVLVILVKIAGWGAKDIQSNRLFIVAVGGSLLATFLTWSFWWIDSKEKRNAVAEPLMATQNEQLKLLTEIDNFIGKRDEGELREIFDLFPIFEHNLLRAKGQFFPGSISYEEGKEIDRFFRGGQGQLSTLYMKIANVNNVVRAELIPGKFGSLNLTAKYTENLRILNHMLSSSIIPGDVKLALTSFRDIIVADTNLMFDVINQSYQDNSVAVFQCNVPGAPYFGTAVGNYAQRFTPLRSSADAITSSVRQYLHIQ